MKDFCLTQGNIGYFVTEVYKLLTQPKKYRVNIVEWREKRSLSANSQTHIWYPIIAEHIGSDAKTVKSRSKIDFGLPILLGSDSEYSKVLGYILEKANFYKMSYEQQEKFISVVKVTSEMSTPECNQYRDNLQAYWMQNGLILEYKKKE